MPARPDFYQFALQHELVEPDATAAAVHGYTDDSFDRLVRDDITMRADQSEALALRHPMNHERWRSALKAVSAEHLQRESGDEATRVRAGRFHQAVMQRQGEANRIDTELASRIRTYLSERNRTAERRRLIDQTILWLAQEVGAEAPTPYDTTWAAVDDG